MRALGLLGEIQLDAGDGPAAAATLGTALAAFERLESRVTPARADTLVALGRARLALGDRAGALVALEQAVDFWRGFDPAGPGASQAAQWLARAHDTPVR
jgi:tetratricopeptide (TPR) repeat protein